MSAINNGINYMEMYTSLHLPCELFLLVTINSNQLNFFIQPLLPTSFYLFVVAMLPAII